MIHSVCPRSSKYTCISKPYQNFAALNNYVIVIGLLFSYLYTCTACSKHCTVCYSKHVHIRQILYMSFFLANIEMLSYEFVIVRLNVN